MFSIVSTSFRDYFEVSFDQSSVHVVHIEQEKTPCSGLCKKKKFYHIFLSNAIIIASAWQISFQDKVTCPNVPVITGITQLSYSVFSLSV